VNYPVKSPRKLIEVALPLDAINVASIRENYIYKGNPSAIHKWWAQRPLGAARAVIFSQLVNDPSWKWELENAGKVAPGHLKASWAASRMRLFRIIEDLVQWENTTNEVVVERARAEIRKSWREVCELNKDHPQANKLFDPEHLPAFHDPFAGGGTIPLEAQRLGLAAYASDLNPVAVLINKAIIEIPPKFAGRAPVRPIPAEEKQTIFAKEWPGITGLAEDVRYYGAWMREEAQKRIGHLYPPIEITPELADERPDLKPLIGQKLPVIAWLWARTVKSPNPVFSHVDVPLASTFILSSKAGKEVYVVPVVEGNHYHFMVKKGSPPPEAKEGTKLARGANFRCLLSHTAIEGDYIKAEGIANRMGVRLMAVVAEGKHGRVYLTPTPEMEAVASEAEPTWKPEAPIPADKRSMFTPLYGLTHFYHLFTRRQLVALTTFSDLVSEVQEHLKEDAITAGLINDDKGLEEGGVGATAYAQAVATYLAFAVSKTSEYSNNLTVWYAREDRPKGLFARQAIPMVWDFPEQNPLTNIGGSLLKSSQIVADSLAAINSGQVGIVYQADAAVNDRTLVQSAFISTDPPYYDNISYADLSDFFYVWLRRSLREIFPNLFATMVVPKAEELVATPYRHGGKEEAEAFFLRGMTQAMSLLSTAAHPAAPLTIYYAFKQSEVENKDDISSTGWVTFLSSILRAGLQLTGTWPIRTERESRSRGIGSNALASSIILVCRKRPSEAPTVSRREFLRELNAVLPEALDEMTRGSGDDQSPVAPVDLSQAIIGPGMAVFSKYAAVLEADGTPMSVRTALQLINRFLAEDDFDHDTQFCLHWFEQYGWKEGRFGEADVLARAKATSVNGLAEAGVVRSGGGTVRLLRPDEYPSTWNAQSDTRNSIWETLHHLIRALRQEGETGSGRVLASVKGKAEAARQLAYRLYTLCERRGWAEDARTYNELITSWTGIESAAGAASVETQASLFDS
jgi:putative DNA methylase